MRGLLEEGSPAALRPQLLRPLHLLRLQACPRWLLVVVLELLLAPPLELPLQPLRRPPLEKGPLGQPGMLLEQGPLCPPRVALQPQPQPKPL